MARRRGKSGKLSQQQMLIGVLLLAIVVLAWYLYKESRTERIELRIGGGGVTIEKK